MKKNKISISNGASYREIGEFWDSHDVTEYWNKTKPVKFEVDIDSDDRYCVLENILAAKLSNIAWRKGISLEKLVNIWIQEKLNEETKYHGEIGAV